MITNMLVLFIINHAYHILKKKKNPLFKFLKFFTEKKRHHFKLMTV